MSMGLCGFINEKQINANRPLPSLSVSVAVLFGLLLKTILAKSQESLVDSVVLVRFAPVLNESSGLLTHKFSEKKIPKLPICPLKFI
jgi:hypothetical protein